MPQINVSVGVAFIAGLVSFFSPCVFSLIPAYIGYLNGRSIGRNNQAAENSRLNAFVHGLAFVAGFSIVFISLGIAISAVSQVFYQVRDILAKAGSIIIILFGLHMTGLFRIPFFDYELKPQSKMSSGGSLISSFLMGVFFSAGWSPCVGPTLGLILTLAAEGAKIIQGLVLLTAYSLGMGIPFILSAFGVDWISKVLKKHNKAIKIVQFVSGVLIIIIGIMLFLGIYQQLLTIDPIIDFGY